MKRTVLLSLLLLMLVSACQLDPKPAQLAEKTLAVGDVAPDFSLPTMSGSEIALEDFRGKTVILNFWATWCGPCREETPDLQRLYEQYGDQDVVILGVSVDDEETVDNVPDFIEEFSLTYPIVLDTEFQISHPSNGTYNVRGIPSTYLIDAEGIVQAWEVGSLDWDTMEGFALRQVDPQAGERRMEGLAAVEAGRELAASGDLEGATVQFEAALAIDPTLSIEPAAEAQTVAAATTLQAGASLAEEGDIEAALAAYDEAQTIDPALEISSGYWNNLCWFGSLWNQAEAVLEACEKGVDLASDSSLAGHRDSRGVARALTGDYEGAIEDFAAFVAWSKENGQYEAYGAQREAWIATLEAGQNPLDEETLAALRDE